MNCSENTRKATQRAKWNQWFRRMFTVALLMGLVVGFFLGRFTAHAFGRTTVEPDTEPSQTVDIQPTQTVIPHPGSFFGACGAGTSVFGRIQGNGLLCL